MDANQLTEKLMEFGLTRQEATVYLALVVSGTQTGYEVAKQTGISRSNAYNALAGLTRVKEELTLYMPKEKAEAEGYLTVAGDDRITDKIVSMLSRAEQRVYLKAEHAVIRSFLPQLEEMCRTGIKVVILTDDRTEMPEHARVYETQVKDYQVGVITDSTHVLTGEVGLGDGSSCLYTGQTNFVQIFKDSLKNEIKLIEWTKGENKK